jgi:hypothetical protein
MPVPFHAACHSGVATTSALRAAHGRVRSSADRADVLPVGGDELGRRPERLVGNAHHRLGAGDVVGVERELPWASKSSVWSGDGYPMWLRRISRWADRCRRLALPDAPRRPSSRRRSRRGMDVPAVGAEPPARVVAEGERRGPSIVMRLSS